MSREVNPQEGKDIHELGKRDEITFAPSILKKACLVASSCAFRIDSGPCRSVTSQDGSNINASVVEPLAFTHPKRFCHLIKYIFGNSSIDVRAPFTSGTMHRAFLKRITYVRHIRNYVGNSMRSDDFHQPV